MGIRRLLRKPPLLSLLVLLSALACSACSGSVSTEAHSAEGQEAGADSATGSTNVQTFASNQFDKLDLLFVIDNSASMADKQLLLAAAVPDLIQRLITPYCVYTVAANGHAVGDVVQPSAAGTCDLTVSKPQVSPQNNIHIGVITTSIGAVGSGICDPSQGAEPTAADMSHLISRTASGSQQTFQDKGFLFWDGSSTPQSGATTNEDQLVQAFTSIVTGAGEVGCGYEAPLEAIYRFMVDPTPYTRMVSSDGVTAEREVDSDGNTMVDTWLLQQRQDFFRQDSIVTVVMLTDENDCSMDHFLPQGFWMLDGKYPKATAACKDTPDAPSCDTSEPTEWWDERQNEANLRCFRQKQRFGTDGLFPIQRYVKGLSTQVFSSTDSKKANPEFFDGITTTWKDPTTKKVFQIDPSPKNPGKPINPLVCPKYAQREQGGKTLVDITSCATYPLRDPSKVFVAGILGVPWQDIARDPTNLAKGFRPAEQLGWTRSQFTTNQVTPAPGVTDSVTIWDHIVGRTFGKPAAGTDPLEYQIDYSKAGDPIDPLMIDSILPRTGTNPATGMALVAPTSGPVAFVPPAGPPNGREWWPVQSPDLINNTNADAWTTGKDLQYACIMPIMGGSNPYKDCNFGTTCDCSSTAEFDNPLCVDETGAYFPNRQYRAKAYPTRRQLAFLKGISNQAVVASICAANVTDSSKEDYGYRPAVAAIVEKLSSAQLGCRSASLTKREDGSVPCHLYEARHDAACDCGSATAVSAETMTTLAAQPAYQTNQFNCACEIPQAQGNDLTACTQTPSATGEFWCYVDANDPASTGCPSDVRVLATSTHTQSMLFLLCSDQ